MPLTVLKTQRRVKGSDKAQIPFEDARQGNCRENTRWRWIETEKSHISFIIKILSDYIKLSNVPNSSSSFIHHFCFHMLLSKMSILFSLTSLHFPHPSHRFLLFFNCSPSWKEIQYQSALRLHEAHHQFSKYKSKKNVKENINWSVIH